MRRKRANLTNRKHNLRILLILLVVICIGVFLYNILCGYFVKKDINRIVEKYEELNGIVNDVEVLGYEGIERIIKNQNVKYQILNGELTIYSRDPKYGDIKIVIEFSNDMEILSRTPKQQDLVKSSYELISNYVTGLAIGIQVVFLVASFLVLILVSVIKDFVFARKKNKEIHKQDSTNING